MHLHDLLPFESGFESINSSQVKSGLNWDSSMFKSAVLYFTARRH